LKRNRKIRLLRVPFSLPIGTLIKQISLVLADLFPRKEHPIPPQNKSAQIRKIRFLRVPFSLSIGTLIKQISLILADLFP
jgi:hypothetical protein